MEKQTIAKKEELDSLPLLIRDRFRVFVEEIMELDNQPFHDQMDDDISQDFTTDDKLQKFFSVITIARDHGKSTHLSIAYPLWRIAKDHNIRILLISRTAGIAESFLSGINGIINKEKYSCWARDIDPDHVGVIPKMRKFVKSAEDWSGKQITIDRTDPSLKDPTIAATGLFGQILSRRADIILCDDIVDQENSMTENQRQKVKDWLQDTVMPVLVPGGTFIYLGNTWHVDDVVSNYLKDPRFFVQKRMGAIINEAERQDLWNEWVHIRADNIIPPRERLALAADFYAAHREEMDRGWRTLWPDRYPYKDLFFMRYLNPFSFARMYQCDPSLRPDMVFDEAWILNALEMGRNLRFQDTPHQGNDLYVSAGGMDLAISQEERADDTALTYLDRVKYARIEGVPDDSYIVRQVHRGHFTPQQQRDVAKNAWELHGLMSIRVESVGYQAIMAMDLQDHGIPITAYNTGQEKWDMDAGINAVALAMEQGKIVIPSDITDPRTAHLSTQLANEMRSFTGNKDDHTGDGLMSLWFAFSEVRALMGGRIIVPGSVDEIKDSPDVGDPAILIPLNAGADAAAIAEQEYERSNFAKLMWARRNGR